MKNSFKENIQKVELDQNKVSKTPVSKQAAKTYSNTEMKPGKPGEKQPTAKKTNY